jgi:hypothetical protein
MRVKALEALSLYYNYGIVTVVADEEVKGGLALHLLEVGAAVEPLDGDAKAYRQDQPAAEDPAVELDIDGTAVGILAWVGDSSERAGEALDAELAKDKPRSTLVKQLEKLTESDSDGE